MKSRAKLKETGMKIVFLIAACVSVFAVVLICVFLFANGIPAMREIGIFDFLLGETWKPGNNIYGILPFILGSLYVTAGAIVLGVPIAILTSIFMACLLYTSGSFTGLRIGSATAKGLGLALDKPLISVPTVDALAYNLYDAEGLVLSLIHI